MLYIKIFNAVFFLNFKLKRITIPLTQAEKLLSVPHYAFSASYGLL